MTTVLALVEADLAERSTPESTVVVVRTDPWRYDTAIGAKESIIADVLEALEEELSTLRTGRPRRQRGPHRPAAAMVRSDGNDGG